MTTAASATFNDRQRHAEFLLFYLLTPTTISLPNPVRYEAFAKTKESCGVEEK